MTPTGSERAKSAFGGDVDHVYLPYDLPGATHRFLDTTRPRLMVIMETELWPGLIDILHKRNIPLVIANARLSERSFRGYQKLGRFMRRLLQSITLMAAQHTEDGERFVALGLKRSHLSVTGSLKFDISVTPELAAKAVTLRRQWAPHRPVWIATSTHDGEEAIILDSHQRLLQQFPRFYSGDNITNVLRQSVPLGLAALGMLFVILTGGIDLSVGSIMAFISVMVAILIPDIGLWPALGASLIAGAVIGAGAGVLVTFFNIAPFIATLAMMTIARGLALIIAKGQPRTGRLS